MEDSLHIAICEDTQSDELTLLSILKECSIPSECTVFHSGEEFLTVFKPHMFDLLLTDIYMGGMTGVDAVTKLRKIDEDIPIAFITTSPDHALEGYRLSVLKYIEKPYEKKEIEDMLRLAQMKKMAAPAITLERDSGTIRMALSQIVYLEQHTNHVFFHLSDGSTVSDYGRLSVFLPQLEENGFFSCHKSFCANMAHVSEINSELKCFTMTGGDLVPIRRESFSKAKQALKDYLFQLTRGEST